MKVLRISNLSKSGDRISWDQNRRSKDFAIMRSTKFGIFQLIKIPNNYLISWSRHFSWDQNFLIMHFRFLISWTSLIMRSKFVNNAFLSFDLMINLLAASVIMRTKFAYNAFLNFDLMKNAAIRRSNNYYKFQSHEKWQNNLIPWSQNHSIS